MTGSGFHRRVSLLPVVLAFLFSVGVRGAETRLQPIKVASGSSRTIVIGFVGGFVHRDDTRHAEVQLARKLQAGYGDQARVEIFKNRQRQAAHQAIRKWLDTDEDGELSIAERQAARIILYGHSWGASAAVVLARELESEQIPVLLTVQVDSIAKNGQDDERIPGNVATAVNFYQTRGWLHGRTKIIPSDPTRTAILGDFRRDYKKMPAECRSYPWFDRLLFKGHTSIECDPQVWNQVEDLINSYLGPKAAPAPTEASLH